MRSALPSAAVLLAGALALTACRAGADDAAGGSTPSGRPPAATSASPSTSAVPSTPASSATGAPATTAPPVSAPARKTRPAPSRTTAAASGDGTSDAYAYKHPCTSGQLSVQVTLRAGAPSQRVIAIRNKGTRSCGLSYYPLVDLDNSRAADGSKAVKPLIPSGLGGPPAHPVYAGRTVYAVIDLDPSGATTGTTQGIDELNVLPDADHMSAAQTLHFPLPPATPVRKPKLGLYRSTIADAVSSMRSADTQP